MHKFPWRCSYLKEYVNEKFVIDLLICWQRLCVMLYCSIAKTSKCFIRNEDRKYGQFQVLNVQLISDHNKCIHFCSAWSLKEQWVSQSDCCRPSVFPFTWVLDSWELRCFVLTSILVLASTRSNIDYINS